MLLLFGSDYERYSISKYMRVKFQDDFNDFAFYVYVTFNHPLIHCMDKQIPQI
jgi:hypothetical protein